MSTGPAWWMSEKPDGGRTSPFFVKVTGYYHPGGPEYTDTETEHSYKSDRPAKRRAELAVLRAAFDAWYEREVAANAPDR